MTALIDPVAPTAFDTPKITAIRGALDRFISSAHPYAPPSYGNEVVVTEYVDGPRCAVGMTILPKASPEGEVGAHDPGVGISKTELANLLHIIVRPDGTRYGVWAQTSRRIVKPSDDVYGFAAWVQDNAEALLAVLGTGIHYGIWHGEGIQRGYGMGYRAFALLDVRYRKVLQDALLRGKLVPGLTVVPELYRGFPQRDAVASALRRLRGCGSLVAPFTASKGVVLYVSGHEFTIPHETDHPPTPLGVAYLGETLVPPALEEALASSQTEPEPIPA